MALPIKGGFAGVKDSYKPLEGTFDAVIEKAAVKEGSQQTLDKWAAEHPGGEEYPGYINWTLAITEEPYTSRKVWYKTTLDPDKKSMLMRILEAVGHQHTPDDLDQDPYPLEPEQEYGKPLKVKCVKDPNDETQTKVRAVMAPTEASSDLLP